MNSWFPNYCQAPLRSFRQSFTVSELAVFMVERYPHLLDITADYQLYLKKQNSLEKTISEKRQAHIDALQRKLKPLQDEISAITSKYQEEKAIEMQPFYEDLTTVKKEIGVFEIFEACKPDEAFQEVQARTV